MSEDRKNRLKISENLIQQLSLKSHRKAEMYEKFEAAARLAPNEVIDLIEDSELVEIIKWIKKSHKKGFPTLSEWRKAYVDLLLSLFHKTESKEKVKKWHELESVCDEITEKETENADKELRKAIEWVKNIHIRSPERRLEIMDEINRRAEESE